MIYVYECKDCGDIKEEVRKMDDRNNLPSCDLCKVEMQRVIGGHNVSPDLHPYYDENLQTGIKSRQHRAEVMKSQGVQEKFGLNWHTAASSKREKRSGRF